MHVQTCYFHNGKHYGPKGCYHETAEEPEEMQPGWTVQSLSRRKMAFLNKDAVRNER